MLLRTFLFCLAVAFASTGGVRADPVRFNRDVRPILSGKCLKCHGPDAGNREADLRFDKEDGIRHAFDGGLASSEGWTRIMSDDPDIVMPPRDSHVELTADEIATIRAWVDSGAPWEGHWSFIPPVTPELPDNSQSELRDWARNAIDAFVLNRLQAAGLQPNAEADRELLIRRVTLDLTGLPPTIEEIDAFVSDTSDAAYEKVVDRLLASPHFGERMAVSWMDAARYGDTSVFHADGQRDMWPWRDWVINAYNSNKRFDEFTREQLAGDLIPEASSDQKVATGFLRNNATTDEGGLIEEEYRVEYAVDRVKTTSMVWMGLSMECAQCHNHKYDPITQDEYYQFFAFFNQAADPGRQTRNGNQAPVVDLFDDAQLTEASHLEATLTKVEADVAARATAAEPEFESWLIAASQKVRSGPVEPATPSLHVSLDETEGKAVADLVQPDAPGKVHGPEKWVAGRSGNAFESDGNNWIDLGDAGNFDGSIGFSYGGWVRPADSGNGAPIARMTSQAAHRGYDLYLANGHVAVHLIHTWPSNAIKVTTDKQLKANEWQHVFVTYDASQQAAGVRIYVNGEPWDWKVEQDCLTATIKSSGPFSLGRRNPDAPYKGLIDDVRVYDRVLSADDVAGLAGASLITPLLAKSAEDRTNEEIIQLRQHFLSNVDEAWQQLAAEQAKLKTRIADLRKPVVNVMVMKDVEEMRDTFVLDRGNYASPLKDRKVTPGVPGALPALPDGSSANRLGLADWLTSPTHPLTARVAVNRYWSLLFGQGIVRTLADFGAQGEWPSHPDLLDWLAADFINSNWNIQRSIKQMVMSATYRQSAVVSPEKISADPQNRLLARGARFRLQAEFVRDNALAASGLLVPKIGGTGVKPYQPEGLWNEVSLNGNLRFEQDHGDNLYRRSMYTYWRRSAPAPSMTIFDAPTREKCAMQRSRTNTPLQALVTLNDVQFVEAARVLAETALQHGGTETPDQIRFAFRRAAGTQPSPQVCAILQEAFDEELARFRSDKEAATQLISTGEAARDEALDPAVHAAMTMVASMILNLDQTLTRS
jgi:hypothetical protein